MGLIPKRGIFENPYEEITLGLVEISRGKFQPTSILDNYEYAVFQKQGFRQRARALAEQYDALFIPILRYCPDDELLMKRMGDREHDVLNWPPVGWEEVLKIRAYFEPWDYELALHLDAANDFNSNMSRALEWIDFETEAR
jgi:hypothetical protein